MKKILTLLILNLWLSLFSFLALAQIDVIYFDFAEFRYDAAREDISVLKEVIETHQLDARLQVIKFDPKNPQKIAEITLQDYIKSPRALVIFTAHGGLDGKASYNAEISLGTIQDIFNLFSSLEGLQEAFYIASNCSNSNEILQKNFPAINKTAEKVHFVSCSNYGSVARTNTVARSLRPLLNPDLNLNTRNFFNYFSYSYGINSYAPSVWGVSNIYNQDIPRSHSSLIHLPQITAKDWSKMPESLFLSIVDNAFVRGQNTGPYRPFKVLSSHWLIYSVINFLKTHPQVAEKFKFNLSEHIFPHLISRSAVEPNHKSINLNFFNQQHAGNIDLYNRLPRLINYNQYFMENFYGPITLENQWTWLQSLTPAEPHFLSSLAYVLTYAEQTTTYEKIILPHLDDFRSLENTARNTFLLATDLNFQASHPSNSPLYSFFEKHNIPTDLEIFQEGEQLKTILRQIIGELHQEIIPEHLATYLFRFLMNLSITDKSYYEFIIQNIYQARSNDLPFLNRLRIYLESFLQQKSLHFVFKIYAHSFLGISKRSSFYNIATGLSTFLENLISSPPPPLNPQRDNFRPSNPPENTYQESAKEISYEKEFQELKNITVFENFISYFKKLYTQIKELQPSVQKEYLQQKLTQNFHLLWQKFQKTLSPESYGKFLADIIHFLNIEKEIALQKITDPKNIHLFKGFFTQYFIAYLSSSFFNLALKEECSLADFLQIILHIPQATLSLITFSTTASATHIGVTHLKDLLQDKILKSNAFQNTINKFQQKHHPLLLSGLQNSSRFIMQIGTQTASFLAGTIINKLLFKRDENIPFYEDVLMSTLFFLPTHISLQLFTESIMSIGFPGLALTATGPLNTIILCATFIVAGQLENAWKFAYQQLPQRDDLITKYKEINTYIDQLSSQALTDISPGMTHYQKLLENFHHQAQNYFNLYMLQPYPEIHSPKKLQESFMAYDLMYFSGSSLQKLSPYAYPFTNTPFSLLEKNPLPKRLPFYEKITSLPSQDNTSLLTPDYHALEESYRRPWKNHREKLKKNLLENSFIRTFLKNLSSIYTKHLKKLVENHLSFNRHYLQHLLQGNSPPKKVLPEKFDGILFADLQKELSKKWYQDSEIATLLAKHLHVEKMGFITGTKERIKSGLDALTWLPFDSKITLYEIEDFIRLLSYQMKEVLTWLPQSLSSEQTTQQENAKNFILTTLSLLHSFHLHIEELAKPKRNHLEKFYHSPTTLLLTKNMAPPPVIRNGVRLILLRANFQRNGVSAKKITPLNFIQGLSLKPHAANLHIYPHLKEWSYNLYEMINLLHLNHQKAEIFLETPKGKTRFDLIYEYENLDDFSKTMGSKTVFLIAPSLSEYRKTNPQRPYHEYLHSQQNKRTLEYITHLAALCKTHHIALTDCHKEIFNKYQLLDKKPFSQYQKIYPQFLKTLQEPEHPAITDAFKKINSCSSSKTAAEKFYCHHHVFYQAKEIYQEKIGLINILLEKTIPHLPGAPDQNQQGLRFRIFVQQIPSSEKVISFRVLSRDKYLSLLSLAYNMFECP